jgi:hypothetical protein
VLRIAAIVLLVLWVLGLVTRRTMGGFVHVLLVLALILGLIVLVRGKNPGARWLHWACASFVCALAINLLHNPLRPLNRRREHCLGART